MNLETLLKTLTEAHGISGSEAPIRALVRAYLQNLGERSVAYPDGLTKRAVMFPSPGDAGNTRFL